ncbi:hypothetical protein HOO68_04335 [Candidatus Gracilibacteria bacterium]|nr:hypothetical protein [Candidatus Gracilibacteria bacterium]
MSGTGKQKIITIVSSITLVLISIHLIGVYIFAGGHYEGVKGGSISIGIVNTMPNPMNPFQYGKDSSIDLVYRFIFRGLVHYDIKTGIYTGDLTNCDLTNMIAIKCTLRDDAVWSDGTRVKTDDVIASIDTFRKSAPNDEIRAFLETVKITKNGDDIEIKSNQKNSHMIEILSYPIVKADTIPAIRDGSITAKTYVTSGPYTFSETALDQEYGFERITLIRNEKWSRSTWLDKIHFKFFKDLASLERSTEALTIVIPPVKNERLDIGPRFREYTYTNYEYFSVFFNTKTMSRILRNTLHWQIGTSFSGNIVEDHQRTNTIFLSGAALLPTENLKSFSDILRDLGYTKKPEIISKIEQTNTTVSGEISFESAKYWTNKANVTTLFIDEFKDEIILTGNVPSNTESVEINGYTLKEYIPGGTNFAYKVNTVAGTLVDGKNTYTLNIKLSTGKILSETLTLYTSTENTKLNEFKKKIQDEFDANQNTPALIAARERAKEEKLKQVRELRDEFYYNEKNNVFTIKIGYTVGPQSTEEYAKNIDAALRLLGVKTELIAYTPKEVQAMIESGERKYDILVIGVGVEGSLSSIGKLFLSSESKSGGLNFSNVENKTLDALFMELRGTTEASKLGKIEESISKIMNSESFFVPISSPNHRIWVDRNIKGMPQVEVIPDIASFVDVFIGTSIKENYIRNMTEKSASGFFLWLASKI